MSTTKRPRRKQPEASPLPASKRQKTDGITNQNGLAFLADEEARKGKKIEARLTNGVPSTKSTRLDESHALVETEPQDDPTLSKFLTSDVIDISSAEDEESDLEDSDEEEQDDAKEAQTQVALANGHAKADDEDMKDGDVSLEQNEELGEPSFGDLLQARHPQPIDVHASFADPSTQRSTLIPTGDRLLAPPATTSLSTVLTQALKTNDRDLLESCFHVTDISSIRATIQRLSSQHISVLLQRLTERIHKAPGRAGILMSWIQWSLVAHGGYLASQPDIMRKLKSLTQIMRERASGLEPLLHLKGKLDMLSAQLDLRRSMLVASRTSEEGEDEGAVLYVEDQDDGEGSEDDESSVALSKRKTVKSLRSAVKDSQDSEADSSEDDLPNGVDHDSDDDSAGTDDEDAEVLIDIEAEETSDDEDDELEEDEEGDSESGDADEEEDEDLSDDDEDMDEEAVRPPEPKTLNRKR